MTGVDEHLLRVGHRADPRRRGVPRTLDAVARRCAAAGLERTGGRAEVYPTGRDVGPDDPRPEVAWPVR